MSIWAILPVKPFEEGKSRLGQSLGPAERRELNRSLFLRTLKVTLEVFAANKVLVVSRSEEVLGIAAEFGINRLREEGESTLNRALGRGALKAQNAGASGVLSLSCDLPYLVASDLEAMLAAGSKSPAVVIAPDRSERGTNAMLMAPPNLIRYQHGATSFSAHCRQVHTIGLEPVIVRRPGLTFDLDTPDDLREWRRQP